MGTRPVSRPIHLIGQLGIAYLSSQSTNTSLQIESTAHSPPSSQLLPFPVAAEFVHRLFKMAAVTKAFLGTSLRAAVPTQGQVRTPPQSVVAVGAAMPSQSVSCMFALSDVFYFSSGPGAFIVPALRIFCCRSLTDSTGDCRATSRLPALLLSSMALTEPSS